jgi:hypothetical protein
MRREQLLLLGTFILAVGLGVCFGMNKTQPKAPPKAPAAAPEAPADARMMKPAMTFFVTSANPGKGADLGGLAGADAYCHALASVVGGADRTWRAYLSTTGEGGVNARDRIGMGPWHNANGDLVAQDLEQLHGENGLTKMTAVNEKGETIMGRGDATNMHDILTGSGPDGRAIAGETDTTCGNWTLGGAEGSAIVGHHDRVGINETAPMKSWNSSHPSRGCGMEQLKSTGGAGMYYCFAAQ